jgi:tripartite-type tricarboxylate transporter receptor subunit TctC
MTMLATSGKRYTGASRAGRQTLILLGLAALWLAVASTAFAQNYPAKPVRIIVPFPPGQATDILARLLADQLSKSFGQQFIVDNRPGAGGSLGTDAAAKSAPDGYTLVMATIATFGINPSLYPRLAYEPLRDFAPIANLGLTPQTLVASPKAKVSSLKDFVAQAKASEVNYASSGNGSASHLTMELFRTAAGIKLNHVPFKGSPEAQTQVFSGDIPVMFDAIPGVLAQIKAGKLKGLGIASRERSPFLPDLPTIAEQGYTGFEAVGWIGIAAPARTPDSVLKTLHAEIVKALAEPETKKRMSELAFIPVGDTPEQFAAFIKAENAKWAKAVKDSGAKVD